MEELNPFKIFLRRCLISSCELGEAIFKIKDQSLRGSSFLTSDLCVHFILQEH